MQHHFTNLRILQTHQSFYGTILKQETLSVAKVSSCPDILVLESKDPFPGFYCSESLPADNRCKDFSYYLPVAPLACCHDDQVCRISNGIHTKTGIMACPAQITLQGKIVRAIRLKNIRQSQVAQVRTLFEEHGLTFHKNKKVNTSLSRIYIKLFFYLEQLDGHIFQHQHSPDLYYLTIPEKLEWKQFEKLITFQKLQSHYRNYDAAIGYWIQKPSFTDFIRIYGKKIPLSELQAIRENFLENLNVYKQKNELI